VLLLPEAPFELLLKSAIARLHEPCTQCLNLVHTELQQMVRDPSERESGAGGLTREVKRPLPSNHPRCEQEMRCHSS
jgi:hypothetical protein